MENLSYLGCFGRGRRTVNCSEDTQVTVGRWSERAAWQPHPSAQPDLLAFQLRHAWRPKYEAARAITKPTPRSCQSTACSTTTTLSQIKLPT